MVALAVQDIEMVLECYFLFEEGCVSYTSSIPTMDKIHSLVKRVDYALLSSKPILNDKMIAGTNEWGIMRWRE